MKGGKLILDTEYRDGMRARAIPEEAIVAHI
jgi:hypothetical protein